MSTTSITILDHTGFESVVTPGVIQDAELVKRSGTTLVGVAASAVTVGVATYANGIRETGGPTTLTMGAVVDTEILTRSGTTIDGVLPSAMTVGTATNANGLRETGGPANLPMGAVAEGAWVRRSGGAVVGATTALLSASVKPVIEAVTAVSGATGDLNTAGYVYAVTYAAAACDLSLPDETQTAFWPVGETRTIVKQNTSIFGINLLASANCTINGAAGGVDATPIAGSLLVPGIAVNAPFWNVYRASTTAYWIRGWAT